MLLLKRLDAFGQVLLILIFLVNGFLAKGSGFLYGYFIVGSWQLISVVLHLIFKGSIITTKGRNHYLRFLLFSTMATVLAFLIRSPELTVGFLMAALFLSPLAAVCYCMISFQELRIWQHRQFIQLR